MTLKRFAATQATLLGISDQIIPAGRDGGSDCSAALSDLEAFLQANPLARDEYAAFLAKLQHLAGVEHGHAGDLRGALNLLKKAQLITPDDPALLADLAVTLLRLEEFPESLTIVLELLRIPHYSHSSWLRVIGAFAAEGSGDAKLAYEIISGASLPLDFDYLEMVGEFRERANTIV